MNVPNLPCRWIEDLQFDWKPFIEHAKHITIRKNEYLYHYGEERQTVYAVLQGRMRLALMTDEGEERTFLVVGSNGLLGEAGLYDAQTHVTSAISNVESELISFSYPVFRTLLKQYSSLSTFCIQNLSRKISILAYQAVENTHASAEQRIIRALWELASTYGQTNNSSICINVKFTQQEMSNVVGVSRVTVANVFRDLNRRGLMGKVNGFYVLHRPDVFSSTAEYYTVI